MMGLARVRVRVRVVDSRCLLIMLLRANVLVCESIAVAHNFPKGKNDAASFPVWERSGENAVREH